MAMTLISTATASGSTSGVQFTNIPQTGKALLALVSCRTNGAVVTEDLALFINDVTSLTYNEIRLRGTGSGVATAQTTGNNRIQMPQVVGASATASTFNSASYYFPNYTSSTDKQVIIDTVNENNATAAQQLIVQGYLDTTAITKLEFSTLSGNVLVANSCISLYIIS